MEYSDSSIDPKDIYTPENKSELTSLIGKLFDLLDCDLERLDDSIIVVNEVQQYCKLTEYQNSHIIIPDLSVEITKATYLVSLGNKYTEQIERLIDINHHLLTSEEIDRVIERLDEFESIYNSRSEIVLRFWEEDTVRLQYPDKNKPEADLDNTIELIRFEN